MMGISFHWNQNWKFATKCIKKMGHSGSQLQINAALKDNGNGGRLEAPF
jgi:hypothetical protein